MKKALIMVVVFLSIYLASSHREHEVGHAAWKVIHKPKWGCNTTTTSTTKEPCPSTTPTTKEPSTSTTPTTKETSTFAAPTTKDPSTTKKSSRIHRREANPIYKKDHPRKPGRAPKYC